MKNILIFGATSAIAERFARIYAKKGGNLYLVARDNQKLLGIRKDLELRGANHVEVLCADLVDLRLHSELVAQVFKKAKKIDIALIAHGILGNQSIAENNFDHAQEIISANFTSAASLLHELAKQFETQRFGTIAVISSVAGDRGRASNYVYGASKAAITAFSSGLRQRMIAHRVNVLTVKPGFIDTPMTREFKKGLLWAKPEFVALGIQKAIERKKTVVYLPSFWWLIMFVIKIIPEKIFQKLKV